jgi:hypothetical protein
MAEQPQETFEIPDIQCHPRGRKFCVECQICHQRWLVEYFGVPLSVRPGLGEADNCPKCRPELWT